MSIGAEAVKPGAFRGGRKVFTNAYFHHPSELAREVETTGFEGAQLFSIEGPGFLVQNFEERWAGPSRREILLVCAHLVETEPEMLAAGSNLLAAATKAEVNC